MKPSRFLLVGAVALMAFAGCEKESGDTKKDNSGGTDNKTTEAYITLSETTLSLSKVGSTVSVTVESNYDWECSYSSNWFKAEKNKGNLSITYDTNETGADRNGVVTVTAGDGGKNVAKAELKITQSCENYDALILEYTITSNKTEIELPIADVNGVIIDWDDGNTETASSNYPSHTYSTPGRYTITINGGVSSLNSTETNSSKTRAGMKCLTAVKQWGNTGLTSMEGAFRGCSGLTSLPDDLSGAFKNVTTFKYAFYDCTALVSAPENMFSNCTASTTFYCCFYKCSALTSAPSFEGCSAATSFSGTFSGCSALTSAPSFEGCSAVTNFWGTFYNCSSLTSIPENIFSNCSNVTDFIYTFCYCSSLTSIPENIFSNCPNVTNFTKTFYNCSSVTGESPYTEIEVDGEKVKVHLYERENYAVEMRWTIPTSHNYCFTNSTFSDIDSIPSGWDGWK